MAECDAVCEQLHLPLQAGSDRTLARMHRGYTAERYLDRLAAARAAIPELAVTTDIIVGFPGETEADFARTLEVVDAAAFDAAYTFIFSPRPGTPAAEMTDDNVSATGGGGTPRAAHGGRRASRTCSPRGAGRTGRGCPRRGTFQDGSGAPDRSDPPGQAPALRGVAHRRLPTAPSWTCGSRSAAPHWLAGELVAPERQGAVPAEGPDPRHRRLTTHLALVGPTASGKSELALAIAELLGDIEIVSVDSMQVYRGLDIGTAKPTVRCAGPGPTPHDRRRRRRGRLQRRPSSRRRRGRRSPTSRREVVAPSSSVAPACTCRPSSTISASPGRTSCSAPSSRPGPPSRVAWRGVRRARAARPRGRGSDRSAQRAPHRACARGHPADRSALLLVRSRRQRVRADGVRRCRSPVCGSRARSSPRRIEARVRAMRARGLLDEVRRSAGEPLADG